jgi:hypothetical protein
MSVADDHALAGAAATVERTGRQPGSHATSGLPRWALPAGFVVLGVLLFLCYLKIANTVPVTSDGGNNAVQAWDLLHGNWLLKGWTLGDASYYTTELPQYALIEIFTGLSTTVVHVAAAMTYVLIVILAGLLARGDRTGKEGLVRFAIAAGIMIAPQIGAGTEDLMLAPNHTGTAVPLLLTFILLDRAPRRPWVPPAIGVLLVWGAVADRTVLLMGVLPIAAVFGARAFRDVVQRRERVADCWFDLAMVGSAVIAAGVSGVIGKIITGLGGYKVLPVNSKLAPSSSWINNLSETADGVLRLFGADFSYYGKTGFPTVLAAIHLVGVALAAWALCRVFRRFFGYDDMIANVLAVAIVVQLVAYAASTLPYDGLQSHEIAVVLPFGAVLAGRVLTGRLTQARLLPALAIVACGYLVALAYGVAQPAQPADNQALAGWLTAHHLTAGVGSYAEGGSTELDSHGAITMAVTSFSLHHATRGRLFEQTSAEFNPQLHYANFVLSTKLYGPGDDIPLKWVIGMFGKPAHTYHFQSFTIYTYNKNLLNDIHLSAAPSRQVVARGDDQPGQRPRYQAGARGRPARRGEGERAYPGGRGDAQCQQAGPPAQLPRPPRR